MLPLTCAMTANNNKTCSVLAACMLLCLVCRYVMKLSQCYQLYGNRAFRWRTARDYLAADAPRRAAASVFGTLAVLALTLYRALV